MRHPLSIDDDDHQDQTKFNPNCNPPMHKSKLFITHPHLAVLPVLLLEFLALALTRAVLPSLLLSRYGRDTYVIMGIAECTRGILAFFACPLFGRLSDVVGRRKCLLVTVAGTLTPVCSLAFWGVDNIVTYGRYNINRIDIFVALLALSGMFSSTFTLTFAYISDVVKDREGRVAAYGLALATFGLSFTIGPLLGGYLANVDDDGKGHGGRSSWIANLIHTEDDSRSLIQTTNSSEIHPLGQHRVFLSTFILSVLDLLYIHFILPESLSLEQNVNNDDDEMDSDKNQSTVIAATASESNIALPAGVGVSRRSSSSWWNPFDSIRYLTNDPLLSTVGRVTFLYYTALHAVVSTLILYAVRQFHMGPHQLGELMAALGLSTMLSEAVLVRIAIPALGEKRAMRVGLISFALQCTLLAVANRPWHLFACAVLAIPGNLVYPSVSSLVSTTVRPDMVGRALGAVNGVKSLTEGAGPLLFGTLLTLSEDDALPGWPYFICGLMSIMAFVVCAALPSGLEMSDESKNGSYKYNMNFRDEQEVEDLIVR